MTEQEAAEKLAAVLNELADAGHDVALDRDGCWVYVGYVHRVDQRYSAADGWGPWKAYS